MDRCVLLTSTPECVVSPRGQTTHEGVDVSNTHLSMINPDYNMMPVVSIHIYQYSAYQKQIKAWIESNGTAGLAQATFCLTAPGHHSTDKTLKGLWHGQN